MAPNGKSEIFTILGAGGSIGNALTHELLAAGKQVRLMSRSGTSWPGAETVRGDVTSLRETVDALKRSRVAFLCVGLRYDTRVWSDLWPRIMANVIEACLVNDTRLVFFDNVYMYGLVEGAMTENTPYQPCSRKGEIRAAIATQMETAMSRGHLRGIIARSADLYGPYATRSSIPYLLVFDRLQNGKQAQWLANDRLPHSFSYTRDCAKALVLLSAQEDALNQVWHLPTAHPAIDGLTFIGLVATASGVAPRHTVLRKWMIRLAGLADPTLRELYEMLYQQDHPYHFDSTKFERAFSFVPTSYPDGIRDTLRFLLPHGTAQHSP
jgi:nucleoside-diphosphate-sugar epimerase